MRCKHCNYRLWQIATRQCPECGQPFKPSDFEFIPNAVRFCCPHCNQAYYGTGPMGHLVPREFDCVTCARRIDMDEMVLLPGEGVADEATEAVDMPWLERNRPYGIVKAWLKTVGRALVRPGDLIRATPPESSAWAALWFALAMQTVVLVGAIAPIFIFMFGMLGAATAGRPSAGIGWHSLGIAAVAIGVVLGISVLSLCVWTLVTHAVLKVTGGCAWGLRRTWQAMCYSSGANVLTATPCVGQYFGWIWWAVSAILMVKDGQRVHGGRATLAVLITPALMIGAIITLYAILIVGTLGTARTAAQGIGPSLVNSSITTQADSAGQPQLAHVAVALAQGRLSAPNFFDFSDEADGGWTNRLSSTSVGGMTLTKWMSATPAERSAAAARVQPLPPNTVAYRIGDTVILIPGKPPGDEWTVVVWRESLKRTAPEGRMITAISADGAVSWHADEMFDEALATQNRLRAGRGLPLIPHPADVKTDQPVVRDDEKHAPPEAPADPEPAPEE